ncbi:MAG: hypothetical protein IKI20_07740 [Lachnospiraceae bacterium]|nr:hypothetical protein [Lachnospiraceae bacterium]
MKEKPFVSRHARKTLHAFIEKEYGADTDAVWKKTIKQYKRFKKIAPDYGGRKIHAGLIREGTCYTTDHCDYCIVSEDNPLMHRYELERNEDGLLISREKVNGS